MSSFKSVKKLETYNNENIYLKKILFSLTGNYVRKIFSKTLIQFEIMSVV